MIASPKSQPDTFVVIRYAAYRDHIDVMTAHMDKLKEKGAVVFAKIGKPIGEKRAREINRAVEQGKQVVGYLVSQKLGKGKVHRIDIKLATMTMKKEYAEMFPDYYKSMDIRRISKSWLIIDSIAEEGPFRRGRFRTQAGGDLVDALDRSMAGMFVVSKY